MVSPSIRKGPFYGWVIIGVSTLAMFASGPGQTFNISMFVDPMAEDLGLSRSTVSALYTFGSLTAAAAVVLIGRLLDKYGARVMLVSIGALLGLAVLAMSMIENPVQLYGGFAALRTLGQGSFTLIPTTLVALWWIRLRGRAIAIITLGITGAQAGLPPLTHWLIEAYGWREAWAVLGIGVWIIVLLPSAVLVRRSPESVGLKPDGQALAQTEGTSQTPTISEPSWSLRQIIPTRPFWLLFFASSSPPLLTTGLMFHNTSLLETRGLDAGTAAFVISTMAPMAVLATFVTGYCADRFTNRYLMAASHALLGLAAVVPLLISEPWHAFIYGAAMGMAMGSVMTMINVIWANYYGRANLGSIRGASTMGVVAFAALGPLPFGILYEATGAYTLPILIFLSLPVASGICSILAGPPSLKTAPPSANR